MFFFFFFINLSDIYFIILPFPTSTRPPPPPIYFQYICIKITDLEPLIYVTAFASHWRDKPDVNLFLEMNNKKKKGRNI